MKSLIGYQILLDTISYNKSEITITCNALAIPYCVTIREHTQEGESQSADFEVRDMVIVKPDKVIIRYEYGDDENNTKEIESDFEDDAAWYYWLTKIFAEPLIENPSLIKKEDVVLIYRDDETKEFFIGTLFIPGTKLLGGLDDSGIE